MIDGIPDGAYKSLTGDDRGAARDLDRRNASEKAAQGELGLNGGASTLPPAWSMVEAAAQLRAMPEETIRDVAARRRAYGREFTTGRALISMACDLYVAAFLSPKRPPENGIWPERAPTTSDVVMVYEGHAVDHGQIRRWTGLADEARSFHWFLAFPDILGSGGFDVVVGNPPWEVMQLGEEEYFAQRLPEVATLKGAARKRAIAALEKDRPDVFSTYKTDKRRFEAANEFARASGRFELSARGKINTYALFAELFARLTSPRGRAGVIVPTGIATDASTAQFFAWLVDGKRLANLIDFENREGLFPAVDSRMKFCLLTIGSEMREASLSFFLTDTKQMIEDERRFTLSAADIALINPNTLTTPIFRSRADASLTERIYSRVPIFVPRDIGGRAAVGLVQNLLSTSNKRDMQLFEEGSGLREDARRPVLRGSMIDQFDHRASTFAGSPGAFRTLTREERVDVNYEPRSDKYVSTVALTARLEEYGWEHEWMLGWRDICRSTDARTMICSVFPASGCDDMLSVILPRGGPRAAAAIVANMNSLVLDYITQQKVGGTHLRKYVISQLAVIPIETYTSADLDFIIERVIELTYTSRSMFPFARALGYDGAPFGWDEERRSVIRSELDARYARLYGLTRDEVRFVLDPADVYGPDYPSETFRVLRDKEHHSFNEYRTARLVLGAWDAEAAAKRLAAE